MKIAVIPNNVSLDYHVDAIISLFQPQAIGRSGSVGNGIFKDFCAAVGRAASTYAWDFASLAMAVIAADRHVNRAATSEDGWTRMIDVIVAVSDPELWEEQRCQIQKILSFLTGDIWSIGFIGGGLQPPPPKKRIGSRPETCVSLLSGGLDSLIGAIDLHAIGITPLLVSNRVRGDCDKQQEFAASISGKDHLVALNHNAVGSDTPEISQRPRSLAFIAFGILAATALDIYKDGGVVDLYIPENGFIAVNVPLTRLRVGSLSTRTTHPYFISEMQNLLDALNLRIRLKNPYSLKTKGEMMAKCQNQELLSLLAHSSMSCGRSQRHYIHCGRCLPCLVRRSAFFRHTGDIHLDKTKYASPKPPADFTNPKFRHFDDVMQCLGAIDTANRQGSRKWIGATMTSAFFPEDLDLYRDVAIRGLNEIETFFDAAGVS